MRVHSHHNASIDIMHSALSEPILSSPARIGSSWHYYIDSMVCMCQLAS